MEVDKFVHTPEGENKSEEWWYEPGTKVLYTQVRRNIVDKPIPGEITVKCVKMTRDLHRREYSSSRYQQNAYVLLDKDKDRGMQYSFHTNRDRLTVVDD